jgi:dTDP-4-amino-4,6-dideoxygalactose transaminase
MEQQQRLPGAVAIEAEQMTHELLFNQEVLLTNCDRWGRMPRAAIPLFDMRLSEADVEAVEVTLRSGWLTMGPRTEEFERAFAQLLGVRHAIAVSSGTAALHLAYLAAGVGPGDEVIVPAVTFVATAAAVRQCGATPVLAEVRGRDDLGVDPEDVAGLIGPRTKAVCAVHYAGYPCDTSRLAALCADREVALIEDSAHHPVCPPSGVAACFSFSSSKVLACGEGGLLATDDDGVARMARSLRSHAMTSEAWDRHRGHAPGYDVAGVGFNYRIDEPRAALLNSRLRRLEEEVERRRALVRRYRSLLRGLDVSAPYRDEEVERSSCYAMPILLAPQRRDGVRAEMGRRTVQTNVLYPAISAFSAYAGPDRRPLPRSELVARSQLTLPLYPHLTEDDQDYVIGALRESLALI